MPEAIVLGCSDMSKAHRNKNRESHNAVERHRKLKINSGISKIAELLPCSSALKQSKNMILEQAVIHIVELNKRCEDLLTNGGTKAQADEIARLRSKISWLRGENVRLCSLLKAHSISSHPDPSLHWRVKSRQRKNSNNDATRLARGGSGRLRGNAKSRLIASGKNGTSVASKTGDKRNVEIVGPDALEFVESEREDSQGQTRVQEKVEAKDGKRQDGEANKKEKRTNAKPGKCRLTVARKAEPVKPRLETPPDPGICSSHSSISSLRPAGLSAGAGTRTMTTWTTLQVGQGFCPQISIPCSTQTIISDVAALLKVTGSCEGLDNSLTREISKMTTPAASSNFIIVQSPRAPLSPPKPLVILHPAQPFTSSKGSSTSRHHFPSILPRPSNEPGVDCNPVGETGSTEQTNVLDEQIFNMQPLNAGNEMRGTRAFGSLQSIQPDSRPTEPVCHVGVGEANSSGVLQIIQPNLDSLETMANGSLSAVGTFTGLNKGVGAPFIKTMQVRGQKTNLSLAKTTDSSLKFVVSQGKLPSINQKSATVHTLLGRYRASTTLSVTNKRTNGRGERQRARAKRVTHRTKPQKSGPVCTLPKTINEQIFNPSIPPVSTDVKHFSTLGLPALVPPSPPGHTSISTVSAVSSPSSSETVAATESIVHLNAVVEADDVVATEVDTVCMTINKDGPSINIVADQDGSTWVSEDDAVQFENRNKDVSIISKDASFQMVENAVVSDDSALDTLDKVGVSSKPSQNITAVVSQIVETLIPESVNVESENLSTSKDLNPQTPVAGVLEKCTTWPATLYNSNTAESILVSSSQSIIPSDIEFSKCITASENDNARHPPSLPSEGLAATQTADSLDNFEKENMLCNRDMAIEECHNVNFVSSSCTVTEQSTNGVSHDATKTGQKIVNTHSESPSASVFVSEIIVTSADMATKSLGKCNTATSRTTATKGCILANAAASSSLIAPISCATSVKNPNSAMIGVHDENCDAKVDGNVDLLGNKDSEEDSQNALPPPLNPTSSDASLVSAEVVTRSTVGGLETQVLNVRPDGGGKGSEKQGIEECGADGTQTDHTPPSAFGGFSVACLLTDVCQAGGAEGHTMGGPSPDSPGDIVALAAQALFSPPAVSAATSLPMQTHQSTDKRNMNTVTCQVDDHFPVISTTSVATCGADISSSVCTNPLATFASCDVSWHVSGGISTTSVPPTAVPFISPTPTSSACSQTLSNVCVKPLTSVSTAFPSTSSTIPTSSCAYTSFAFGAEIRGRASNEGVFPTLRGFEGPAGNGIQGNRSLDKTGLLPIHCPGVHQQAADSEGERHLPFLTQLRDIRTQPMRTLGTYSSRTTLAKRSYSGHSGNSSPSSGHPLPTSGKRRKHGRDGGPASSHSYDRHATPNFGLVEAAGVRQYYHGPHGDGCASSGFPQKNLQVNPSSCPSSTSDAAHLAGHATRPLAPSAPQNLMPPCPQQQPQHVPHQFTHSHHSNHLHHHHHHHHLSGQSSHSAAPPFSFTAPEELGILESGSVSAGLDFSHYHGFTSGRHPGTAHFNDLTVPDVCFQNPCVPLRSSSYSAESLIAGGGTQRRGSREMTPNRVSHQLPPAYSDNYSPVTNPSALGTPRCLISETTKPVPEMVGPMHPSIHHQHSQQSYSSTGSSVGYGPRLDSETMGSCGFGRTTGQLGGHSHRATQHTRSEDLGSLAVSVPGSRNGSRDHRSASTGGGSGGLKTPENKARARAKSSRGAVQSTYGGSRCPSFLPDTSHFVQNFTFPFVAADGSTGGSMAASVAPAASTTNFSHQVHLTSTSSGSVAQHHHHHHNPVAPPPPSLLAVDGPPPYFPAYPPPRPSADVPPLPIFSNQLFVSASEKPPARGALGSTFAPPLLSPPRPVAFPQPGFPPLLSDTSRSHAVPGGASATVSPCALQPGPQTQPAPPLFPSFNLTSLFPEITVASNAGGESQVSVGGGGGGGGGMTMPPPASHGGAEGGKQTGGTRGTHNISRILGHNGSSA